MRVVRSLLLLVIVTAITGHAQSASVFETDVVLEADGILFVNETIETLAVGAPGAWGPNITLRATSEVRFASGVDMIAANGRPGADSEGVGRYIGGPGGRGGNIVVDAPRLTGGPARLFGGFGGNGGNATSIGDPHAWALGGDGGDAGVVIIEGEVEGDILAWDGNGGAGGNAVARGENRSETAAPGSDAWAKGGRGGDGGVTFSARGGRGGNAEAHAGIGGPGKDACFATSREAARSGLKVAGTGGGGSLFFAEGGAGGAGWRGADGGSAYGWNKASRGGNATPPITPGPSGGTGRALREGETGLTHYTAKGGNGGTGWGEKGGDGGASTAIHERGSSGTECGGQGREIAFVVSPVWLSLLVLLALLRRPPRQR